MGELGELRSRVDQAVERLSTTNETRRRQSRGLMTLLTDLEGKYQARSEEVEKVWWSSMAVACRQWLSRLFKRCDR